MAWSAEFEFANCSNPLAVNGRVATGSVKCWRISSAEAHCFCEAADLAIQVHGGIGYTRHMPFEHIYRHHRRYRITEGSEEIQIRRVAGALFGFWGAQKASTAPR